MKPSVDSNDRQFLDQLHRLGSGTIAQICDESSVTATAVRQRLVRLMAAEMVVREVVRSGRGRPHHIYRVSDVGLRELGDNYANLAIVLWREMCQIEEPDVRARIAGRVRSALVNRYGASSHQDPLGDRMEHLQQSLSRDGFDIEIDTSGLLPVLRERNCPYHELAMSDSRICMMEQEVFEDVLGAEIRLTQSCRDGSQCCEFHVGDLISQTDGNETPNSV